MANDAEQTSANDNTQRPRSKRRDWTPEQWDKYYEAIADASRECMMDLGPAQSQTWAMAQEAERRALAGGILSRWPRKALAFCRQGLSRLTRKI